MTLQEFNTSVNKFDLLKTTCGASSWANKIIKAAPFSSIEILLEEAKNSWFASNEHEYSKLEEHAAFTHVRLKIYPDGGVSRLRLFGKIV